VVKSYTKLYQLLLHTLAKHKLFLGELQNTKMNIQKELNELSISKQMFYDYRINKK